MRPVDNKNAAPRPDYDGTFENSTGVQLLHITQHSGGAVSGLTFTNQTGNNALYNFFRNGGNFNMLPIGAGAIDTTGTATPSASTVQVISGIPVRPEIPDPNYIAPPGGQKSHIIYRQTYKMPPKVLGVPNRDNSINPVTINARIQAINIHQVEGTSNKRYQRLRILLPPEEAAELARIWQEDQWNGTTVLANLIGGGTTAASASANAKILRDKWIFPELCRTIELVSGYTGYKGAKTDLEKQLGKYCSYCESRHQDGQNLAIEHRITKGDYPTEYLRWDNFVLACTICNSNYKGTKPSRNWGINKAIQIHGYPVPHPHNDDNNAPVLPSPLSGQPLPYHEILGAAQDYHLWPDVSEMVPPANNPASLSLRLCNYQLHDVGGGAGAGVIPIVNAVNLQNTRDRVVNTHDALLANVWNPGTGTLQQRQVQVQIAVRNLATGTTAFDNRKNTATGNTISLVGLNQVNNSVGDQRMLERTEAWFKAIKAVADLKSWEQTLKNWWNNSHSRHILGWVNQNPQTALFNDYWDFACNNAEQTGFYSVWVTVFKQHNLAEELVTRLNNRSTTDPNSFNRYHGTNITNSVLPYIPEL